LVFEKKYEGSLDVNPDVGLNNGSDVITEQKQQLPVQAQTTKVQSTAEPSTWGIPETRNVAADSWGSMAANPESWSQGHSWTASEQAHDSTSDVSGWGSSAAPIETWGSSASFQNSVTIDNWSSINVGQETADIKDAVEDDQVT